MSSKDEIRSTLRRLGVSPSKQRGQNFLLDKSALFNIAESLDSTLPMIEIGPGLGALTERLIERCNRLLLVEVQEEFTLYLEERFPGFPKSQILQQDIRKLDFGRLLWPGPYAIAGNLPYSLSTDILLWMFDNKEHITHATLLLQKEFVERVAAAPGSKSYGSLSIFCQLNGRVDKGVVIPGESFWPPAKVASQVLRIKFFERPPVDIINPNVFRQVVREAFSTRRKMLINSLTRSGIFASKEEGRKLLEAIDINPNARPETLSLEQFAKIANALK